MTRRRQVLKHLGVALTGLGGCYTQTRPQTETPTETSGPDGRGTDTGETATPADVGLIEDLRATTRVGTEQRTGAAARPAFGEPTLTDPTQATDLTTSAFRGGTGGVTFGGTNTRPRRDEEPDQEDEEEPLGFGLGVAADEFDSGIASAEDLLR